MTYQELTSYTVRDEENRRTRLLAQLRNSLCTVCDTGENKPGSPLPYTWLSFAPRFHGQLDQWAVIIDHPGQPGYDVIVYDREVAATALFNLLADAYSAWSIHVDEGQDLMPSTKIPTIILDHGPIANRHLARLDTALEPLRAKITEPKPTTVTISRSLRERLTYRIEPDQMTDDLKTHINLARTTDDEDSALRVYEAVQALGLTPTATSSDLCDEPEYLLD